MVGSTIEEHAMNEVAEVAMEAPGEKAFRWPNGMICGVTVWLKAVWKEARETGRGIKPQAS